MLFHTANANGHFIALKRLNGSFHTNFSVLTHNDSWKIEEKNFSFYLAVSKALFCYFWAFVKSTENQC